MIKIDYTNCTGCSSCIQACPQKCICMQEDANGFLYPQINEALCYKCGLCMKKCPIDKELKKQDYNQEVFAFIHKDKDVFYNSSSGGAFTALTDGFYALYPNAVVFGATMDSNFEAVHKTAFTRKQAYTFRKSKYIPSIIGDTYNECETLLKKGIVCLYSGTPCQIAGLKTFLGKDYSNLFTIDVLCRGVGNTQLFKSYIHQKEKKLRIKIEKFTFRYKMYRNYGKERLLSSENILIGSNRGDFEINRHSDPYMIGYHNALFYRECCYSCKYAGTERNSDITLSDFWGYEEINGNYSGKGGISAILINSEKGKKLAEASSLDKHSLLYEKACIDDLKKRNRPLNSPEPYNTKRTVFFKNLDKFGFEKAVYACYPKTSLWKRALVKIMPQKVIRKIKLSVRRK